MIFASFCELFLKEFRENFKEKLTGIEPQFNIYDIQQYNSELFNKILKTIFLL